MTGKRGGVTRSKGTLAGSRTQVHCRTSPHGTRALPTELNGAPLIYLLRPKLLIPYISTCNACVRFPVVFYLILTDEFLVRDVGRQICVQESTESQAVTPAAAEVGNIDILS